jgi:hypothetical protein
VPKVIRKVKHNKPLSTTEATSFLRGLFQEFLAQTERYGKLTGDLLSLEARIELAEKMLCLTRDHLAMTIKNTDSALPNDWDSVLKSVRFVGIRLGDACIALLQERNRMTQEEILRGLNAGMFRFRTNSPLREIHAALLRHPSVKKEGRIWIWTGSNEQMPLRLRVEKSLMVGPEILKDGTNNSKVND